MIVEQHCPENVRFGTASLLIKANDGLSSKRNWRVRTLCWVLYRGRPPDVRGRPLCVVLKDNNFGFGNPIMQLGVWSKGDNSY